jgi:tetratricopeptide (TPR) repeat protein
MHKGETGMFQITTRAFLVAFGLALIVGSARAQPSGSRAGAQPPGQINGQVRFADTRQPAYNVLVSCDGFPSGFIGQVQTDRNGRFTFNNLGPAQFIIRVQAPGYVSEQQTAELQTTSNAYLQFSLQPDPNGVRNAPTTNATVSANIPAEAQKEYEAGRLALLDEKKQNLSEGVQHLEKALALYPKYLEAEMLLGTGYMDMKEWGKAEQALRRALALNPKAAGARFALGEVYRRQKKYKEAETELLEGLKLDDKSVPGHFTLGRVYFEQGDIVKAGPHVGQALQLDPKLAEGHLLAGNILLKARQPDNALAEFQAYLVLAPDGEFAPQARTIVDKLKQATANKKPQ